jgi:hypothetical protein
LQYGEAGEEIIGLIIGGLVEGYVGGFMASGFQPNPEKWNTDAWVFAGMGAVQGGFEGYSIGSAIAEANKFPYDGNPFKGLKYQPAYSYGTNPDPARLAGVEVVLHYHKV